MAGGYCFCTRLNVAVFFIIAVVGLEVFGVILAGYASASKWSLFGAMREAAQVVSYEVPLGMCVVVPVMITGTMDLVAIAQMQSGWFTQWLVFHDPFTFIIFWVYFTCATASVNRAPFDLAEAESELVAGFHTEYSGLRWSIFFMAEYGSMFAVSGLAAILFFGGWNGPLPVTAWLGAAGEAIGLDATSTLYPLFHYLGNFLGIGNIIYTRFNDMNTGNIQTFTNFILKNRIHLFATITQCNVRMVIFNIIIRIQSGKLT